MYTFPLKPTPLIIVVSLPSQMDLQSVVRVIVTTFIQEIIKVGPSKRTPLLIPPENY